MEILELEKEEILENQKSFTDNLKKRREDIN